MRDVVLEMAGMLAILVAVTHGVLGETRVFARAQIEPAWAKRLVYAVWQCSTVAWLAGGVLLCAIPLMSSDPARRWIIAVLIAVYASAAVGNAWASRGRHFGWMLLSVVVALALCGL